MFTFFTVNIDINPKRRLILQKNIKQAVSVFGLKLNFHVPVVWEGLRAAWASNAVRRLHIFVSSFKDKHHKVRYEK